MKANHTPGKWRVCIGSMKWNDAGDALIVDAGQHTSDIAWIPGRYEDAPRMEERRRANAQLIADAPELLELCRELLGPMIVWSQYWGNAYNGGKSSPAHEEIIQRASIVIARNTHEDSAE